ncbi:hypothetical protein D9M69_239110 [compost metagenome]
MTSPSHSPSLQPCPDHARTRRQRQAGTPITAGWRGPQACSPKQPEPRETSLTTRRTTDVAAPCKETVHHDRAALSVVSDGSRCGTPQRPRGPQPARRLFRDHRARQHPAQGSGGGHHHLHGNGLRGLRRARHAGQGRLRHQRSLCRGVPDHRVRLAADGPVGQAADRDRLRHFADRVHGLRPGAGPGPVAGGRARRGVPDGPGLHRDLGNRGAFLDPAQPAGWRRAWHGHRHRPVPAADRLQ